MSAAGQLDLFAPLPESNGAPMAQMAQNNSEEGGLRHCAIWGSAQGANPAKALNGAATHPSEGDGANHGLGFLHTPATIQESLIALSEIRARLQPSIDAYTSTMRGIRERLQMHHEQHGMNCGEIERRKRLNMHDEIITCCEKHGKSVIAYRENKKAIDALVRALENQKTEKRKR